MTGSPAPLPPLPPPPLAPAPPPPFALGGEMARRRPTDRDLVDLLTDEHYQLAALCAELVDAAGPPRRRRELADVVVASTVRHLCAEEQYLYPTVRRMLPDGAHLAEQELVQDAAIRAELRDLDAAAPDEPAFEQAAGRVAARLFRHARAAATGLLPAVRAALPRTDLVRLGSRVAVAEEAAPTRPHPGAPSSPPWNKLVDPAWGVVDKLRDAATGRATYPEDL